MYMINNTDVELVSQCVSAILFVGGCNVVLCRFAPFCAKQIFQRRKCVDDSANLTLHRMNQKPIEEMEMIYNKFTLVRKVNAWNTSRDSCKYSAGRGNNCNYPSRHRIFPLAPPPCTVSLTQPFRAVKRHVENGEGKAQTKNMFTLVQLFSETIFFCHRECPPHQQHRRRKRKKEFPAFVN